MVIPAIRHMLCMSDRGFRYNRLLKNLGDVPHAAAPSASANPLPAAPNEKSRAAPDLFSAKGALGKCTTGWETPAKAEAWLRVYRQWRNKKLNPDDAAAKANAGETPA